MSHSYDVIKPLSKQITCNCAVFIPVSNGKKLLKNPLRETRVIVENNVASFFPDMVYCMSAICLITMGEVKFR